MKVSLKGFTYLQYSDLELIEVSVEKANILSYGMVTDKRFV